MTGMLWLITGGIEEGLDKSIIYFSQKYGSVPVSIELNPIHGIKNWKNIPIVPSNRINKINAYLVFKEEDYGNIIAR